MNICGPALADSRVRHAFGYCVVLAVDVHDLEPGDLDDVVGAQRSARAAQHAPLTKERDNC